MSIDKAAMFKLSYGLFVLTARDGQKDSGCITNTAIQLTDKPLKVSIAVNKNNYTCEMISNTKAFNLSIITQSADFEIFKRFGFQSGRDTDKFADFPFNERTGNGIRYLSEHINGVISGEVVQSVDCGTHTLFIANVVESFTLPGKPSATYQYYFDNIKPKPAAPAGKGFVCKVCGHVYNEATLPPDYVCPICKHGADAFEAVK